jgi:hypothetical protein
MADYKMSPMPQQKPLSEKKEFLRREEIKTMQKEISKIREEGAQEEREKIKSFEAAPKTKKEAVQEEKTIQKKEEKKIDDATRLRMILEQARKKTQSSQATTSQTAATNQVTPPLDQKPIPKAPIKNVEPPAFDQKKQIEETLRLLLIKKQSLETRKDQILKEVEQLKASLLPITEKEKAIKAEKTAIEEKEAQAALPEEKRTIENSRWQIDKQRQEIEKERWGIEEDLEDCQKEQSKIAANYQAVLLQEKEMQSQLEKLKTSEGKQKLIKEKNDLQDELAKVQEDKTRLENEKEDWLFKKTQATENLQKIIAGETAAENDIKQLEEKENLAQDPVEKRKIGQQRWAMENQRATTEKMRWDLEAEANNINLQLQKNETSRQEIVKKEESIKNRVRDISFEIGPEEALPKEPVAAPEPVIAVKPIAANNPARQPSESSKMWTKPDVPNRQVSFEPPRPKESTVFQRPESSAMNDTERRKLFFERTRELEDKNSALTANKNIEQGTIKKTYDQSGPAPESLHKKQSALEKVWVRIIILLLILAILFCVAAFWYWYLAIYKK